MTVPSILVRDVTADTFTRDVVEPSHERPVLVDFWSPGCQPCRLLGPLLERLVEERGGEVLLAKVNTDEEQELAAYFRISAIPAVKVIFNGQIIHELEGLLPESALRRFLDEIVPPRDPALEQARADEGSDPAAAEKEYRHILAEQADNESARLGLARALLALGRPDEIDEVLEPVGAGGEAGTEADRIKAQAWLLGKARGLPDEAALRQRVAAEPANAQARLDLGCLLASRGTFPEALALLLEAGEQDPRLATGPVREAMVKVFYALGSNHPLANDYRSRLSRLLY
jgi:putative thioredoxin